MNSTTGQMVYEVVNAAGDVVFDGTRKACVAWLQRSGYVTGHDRERHWRHAATDEGANPQPRLVLVNTMQLVS